MPNERANHPGTCSASKALPADKIVTEDQIATDAISACDARLLRDAELAFAAMAPEALAAYRQEAQEIETGFGDPAVHLDPY